MKYCPHCGAEVSDNAFVCTKCGSTLDNNQTNNSVSTESSVIGILAIVFSALGGCLGLIFAIIGLCTYKESKNRRYCFIALGIFAAWFVIGLIIGFASGLNQFTVTP